ncbi:MAG: glycine cleavage system aminomethyltransferase GcvT [Thermaerobacter sp.]|nr:glycine cleavage system aminomethyltransferase GcvT [Thermaerobacter sp.]
MGKKTPLYEEHLALGGRMVDFGGWDMPVQYTAGILAEHEAVRKRAGLFDVSHMGEIECTGDRALAFADYLVTNNCQRLNMDQVLYTAMCYPDGGVVDDLLVYRLQDRVLLVVNASNTEKDVAWVTEQKETFGDGVQVRDVSAETAQIALQGPKAQEILQRLTEKNLDEIAFFYAAENVEVAGRTALVSRTGYTGEDGFEIYLRSEDAVHVWREILRTGAPEETLPCGLGARDSLRFEACLPLYGHELDREHNPLEAGLKFFVKLQKPDFIGHAALAKVQEDGGPARRLIGYRVLDRGIARQGYPLLDAAGRTVGITTSGMPSLTLGGSIGLGYVPAALAQPGTSIAVEVRGRAVPAEVVKIPFYRRSGK